MAGPLHRWPAGIHHASKSTPLPPSALSRPPGRGRRRASATRAGRRARAPGASPASRAARPPACPVCVAAARRARRVRGPQPRRRRAALFAARAAPRLLSDDLTPPAPHLDVGQQLAHDLPEGGILQVLGMGGEGRVETRCMSGIENRHRLHAGLAPTTSPTLHPSYKRTCSLHSADSMSGRRLYTGFAALAPAAAPAPAPPRPPPEPDLDS